MKPGRPFFHSISATAFCLSLLLWSCSTNYSTTASSRLFYDYESQALHPDYILYHVSDDSTELHMRVRPEEVLFTRRDASTPFEAKLSLFYALSRVDDSGNLSLTDSGRFALSFTQQEGSDFLEVRKNIPVHPGNYRMELELKDLSRNTSQLIALVVDKSDVFGSQNFLLTDLGTGEPVYTGVAAPDAVVEIRHDRGGTAKVMCYRIEGESKLPPPPFSTNSVEQPDLNDARVAPLHTDSAGHRVLRVENGLYFFTTDPKKDRGLSLLILHPNFPFVEKTDQLVWPLRYITSKSEFEEMEKSKNPKELVDRFWMDCAGSKDRARELIRIYYNRVLEANYYFTSFAEGWRTDRGMVHVVFGQPNRIYRNSDNEVWLYGEEGNVSSLQFMFRKAESSLSNNVYLLNRDPLFRTHWERAVTAWRNGKVFGE